jgi:hypothetical protein
MTSENTDLSSWDTVNVSPHLMQKDAEIHQTKCDETINGCETDPSVNMFKILTVMNKKCIDVWDMMP